MRITVFDNIRTITDPWRTDPVSVLKSIKDGACKEKCEKLRDWEVSDEEKDEIKKSLRSICFSGDFSERNDKALIRHSGLIVLDIDGLKSEDLNEIKYLFVDWDFTYSVFVSPRGAGLKVLVRISDDPEHHRLQFLSLKQHWDIKLAKFTSTIRNEKKLRDGTIKKKDDDQGDYLRVEIDPSGINVSRVCYESYDPEIYWNEDSEHWDELYEETESEKEPVKREIGTAQPLDLSSSDIIERLEKWLQKRDSYYEGNRNNYIYKLASAFCRYGITKSEAESYILHNYGDYSKRDAKITISSAYKSSQNIFGSAFFEQTEEKKPDRVKDKQNSDKEIEDKELGVFWGWDGRKISIHADKILKFINAMGFYTYRFDGNVSDVEFVRVKNKIVEFVGIKDIKDAVLKHVAQYNEVNAKTAEDHLLMKPRYFDKGFLNALPELQIEDVRDKRNEIYLFFEDKDGSGYFYSITKNEVKKKSLLDMPSAHVWKSHLAREKFQSFESDFLESDFVRFVERSSGGGDRFEALCTSIGYLMHTYKLPSMAKLVYLFDGAMGELDGEANGGTGKNLVLKCLEYCRTVVNIDGKDFDPKNKHKFESVREDTQLVFIDDYEGDTKELFAKITGTFSYKKMYQSEIQVPFEKSPKIAISSNKAPKGISSSYIRRTVGIEFSNYYNEDKTPRDEFGRDFFSDEWGQKDWDALYSFLIFCAQKYLKEGVKEVESSNTKEKQLVRNTSQEFAEWILNVDVDLTEDWNGREIFKRFLSDLDPNEAKHLKVQIFYGYVRTFCKIYGYKLYESKATGTKKTLRVDEL